MTMHGDGCHFGSCSELKHACTAGLYQQKFAAWHLALASIPYDLLQEQANIQSEAFNP